jgi:hypothetical protein
MFTENAYVEIAMTPEQRQPSPEDSRKPQGTVPDIPNNRILDMLSRILDYLFVQSGNLPPALRAIVYFVFLTFFCATAWRLVAGQYVVRGVIWDGDRHASGCEIRLRGDYFSTNSKGMYYAVLSPSQYIRYWAAGDNDLQIERRQNDGSYTRLKGPFKVNLSWWDDEFSSIDVAPTMALQQGRPAVSFQFVDTAYAEEAPRAADKPVAEKIETQAAPSPFPSSGDRLVIDHVIMGASAMHEAEFEVELAGRTNPLLLRGSEAGRLPMKSNVELGNSFYFDVPKDHQNKVVIEMEGPSLFGFGIFTEKETFNIRQRLPYNKLTPISGSKGSTLIVRLIPKEKSVGGGDS